MSGARYAALATYDDAGQIKMFVHHGVDAAAATRIGRLPTGRGLLGLADSGELRQRIAEARDLVVQALRDVQDVASGLRPAALDDLGLAAALERLAGDLSARHGVPIEVAAGGLAAGLRLTAEKEIAAYRVVQEALTNAVRHARADRVTMTVSCAAGMLRAAVEDDGIGFDAGATPRRSLGLAGMRERLAIVGGALSVVSHPGQGTHVVAEVPVE